MKQIEKKLSSREVAKMMEMEHPKLLRKIDGINVDLAKSKIGFSKYWVESTYKVDGQEREYREFQITKRGCEFLAHKTTGTKGNLFTDRYMDAFEEMKEVIEKPKSAMDKIRILAEGSVELEQKIESVDKDLQDFKQDLPLLGCDMDKITTAVRRKGVDCLGGKGTASYHDSSLRGRVYTDIYSQLKRNFGVTSYKSIKRNQCDRALEIIEGYILPDNLYDEINDCNNQMQFN